VIGDRDADGVDLTCALAALTVSGPLARELFARFCALDLRPQSLPVGGFRPGSVARTPGYVLREDEDRFLMLFGWALGEYMWTVVADAATSLGGAPMGADALDREAARA
jgi:heterotetrameric sarcosine oxidase gamma subunit